MTSGSKALVFVLAVAGLGTAGYFLTRRSNKELRLLILSKSDSLSERQRMTTIVNKMNRQELVDTWHAMQIAENTPPASIDPVFKARIAAIGAKYNIFT